MRLNSGNVRRQCRTGPISVSGDAARRSGDIEVGSGTTYADCSGKAVGREGSVPPSVYEEREHRTVEQIGQSLGVSRTSIPRALQGNGIPRPTHPTRPVWGPIRDMNDDYQ